MKYIKSSIYLFAILLILGACERNLESEGISKVTYFPTIEIAGDLTVYIPTNSSYTDEGATATEQGEPIEVTSSSTLDVTAPGAYTITYMATNSDGFVATAMRSVYVFDENVNTELPDLSGTYLASVDRNNGGEVYNGLSVTLTALEGVPGTYYISDWIAGFYAQGRDYGSAYDFTGLIQIDADNNVVEVSMTNAWNDPFDYVTGIYDSETGAISYDASWLEGTYVFAVTLTK